MTAVVVLSLPGGATRTLDERRRRPFWLDGLSDREALELFIAAYVSDPERSALILRAMSDKKIEEALSFLDEKLTARSLRA